MIHSGIPTSGKQSTPTIPLENDYYSRKKPTDSSSTLLTKRTSRMKKLTSLPKLKSKEKASSPSSIGVEYSQVSTENDHLSNVFYKLTPEELSKLTNEEWIEMGKSNKQSFWGRKRKYTLKLDNEKWEKIIHLKKEFHTIKKKKGKNSTIETKFDKFGKNVSMLETSNEVYEEKVTKEKKYSLSRFTTASFPSGIVETSD